MIYNQAKHRWFGNARLATRSFLLNLLVSFAMFFSTLQPASAVDHKTVIPVFFATDRVMDPDVSKLNYCNRQLPPDELTFGIKNIVLVGDASIEESAERLSGLGWWSLIDPNDPSPPSRTTTATKATLFENVKKVMAEGPQDRPLVLYIHGCCSDFNKTTTDAARLGRSMAAPVLAYAWAAIPPITAYNENGPVQSKSGKRFNDFLGELEKIVPANRIVLVGYSMGNRFLSESLKFRYWNYGKNPNYPKFKAACFMCADVPLRDTANQLEGIIWDSEHTIATKNDTDPALEASKLVNGFTTRFGAPRGDFKILHGKNNIQFYDIQPILSFKHDLPIELLAQIVRQDSTPYKPYVLEPRTKDLTTVKVRNKTEVHATIKE